MTRACCRSGRGISNRGVAWATTDAGLPTIIDRWPGTPDGTTQLVADALDLAVDDQTSRLGRLLAPMGVRYVVIVEADRPVVGPEVPVPASLPDALEPPARPRRGRGRPWAARLPQRRLVLRSRRAPLGRGRRRARTDRWAPGVADLRGSPAVLVEDDGVDRYVGPVEGGSTIWWSAASSSGWRLSAAGETAERSEGFGWGNLYAVGDGGDATLSYQTPLTRLLFSAAQAAVWVLVLRALLVARRRDRPKELR